MTTPIVRPGVARFVADVRAQLDDLPPEELDELTGGLEANLADAVDVSGVAALGDPVAYAAELRAAAGLAPRGRQPGRVVPVATVRRAVERLRAEPWWPPVREFLEVVRPAWWVLRGWIGYGVLALAVGAGGELVPGNPVLLLLLAVCVVASVQFGRRRRPSRPFWRTALVVGNVVAVLLVPAVLSGARPEPADDVATQSSPTGLSFNGSPVTNVYAYDDQGRLLPAVQLYDEAGRPLDLDESSRADMGDDISDRQYVPAVNADGRTLWNVYPERLQRLYPDANGNEAPSGTPAPPAPPFRSVAPVLAPTPTASPSPTASASARPTATPPTSTATVTVTPSPSASPAR